MSSTSVTPRPLSRTTAPCDHFYIDSLVAILERHNPATELQRRADSPANGVFDTIPNQTLVLLTDFESDRVRT